MIARVCVVGSLNEDTTLRVSALPTPGETVLTGGRRRQAPGGKGANQASAARAVGAEVVMVGAVGSDDSGGRSLASLSERGVDVTGVLRRQGTGTGIAVITVDDAGENTIVVDPGANGTLTPEEAAVAVRAAAAALVLLQLEVPDATVISAARAAEGALVVLNPAPMPADPAPVLAMLRLVDVLVPNRSELGRLTGRPEPTDAAQVEDCVAALDYGGSVVVTLGAAGALCFEKGATPVVVPGEAVETVDASGAGDVFCGSLAHDLAAGSGLVDAVRQANRLAAASTRHLGARLPVDFSA